VDCFRPLALFCFSIAFGTFSRGVGGQGAPFQILSPKAQGTNGLAAGFSGAPTFGVVVESSFDLLHWESLATVTTDGNAGVFVDQQPTLLGLRFYRLRTPVFSTDDPLTVETLADLRLIQTNLVSSSVFVRGYRRAGDGGGGLFYWDAESAEPDDGGITIEPPSHASRGRWVRAISDNVNVRWFGASGSGLTDDGRAIQAALDYVDHRDGGTVFVPAGTYYLQVAGVSLGNNINLVGEGAASVIYAPFSFQDLAVHNHGLTSAFGNTNITVRDLTIDCVHLAPIGLGFCKVVDSTIHNVWVRNSRGYGLYIEGFNNDAFATNVTSKRVTISACHVTGVIDVGIELRGATEVTVVGNHVSGTAGIAYLAWDGSSDCVFSGNVAEGVGANNRLIGYQVQPRTSADFVGQTRRISVLGNVAVNVYRGFQVRGTPDSKPTDISVAENVFTGMEDIGVGAEVSEAARVDVHGNHISGFAAAFALSNVTAGHTYDSASYVLFDQNTVRGGRTSRLYGNVGGSFSGNAIYDLDDPAVFLFAWRNCIVNNNLFVNVGSSGNGFALIGLPSAGVEMTGNSFVGNVARDDRPVKLTAGVVAFSTGSMADYNVVMGNSAAGAKPGALAFVNGSDATHNVVLGNVDEGR
jgi:hypothetical protein